MKINANDLDRTKVPNLLSENQNIGIELGVAKGDYSYILYKSNKFKKLYGVDSYEDIHQPEYLIALKKFYNLDNYHLFKCKFEEALDLFPDEYFDFIYIDGYAHTGQEAGKTLSQWYTKLKIGGIFSGDDYDENWPLTVKAVNNFSSVIGEKLYLTGINNYNDYSKYKSWYLIKNKNYINLNEGNIEIPIINKIKIKLLKLKNKFKYFLKSKLF